MSKLQSEPVAIPVNGTEIRGDLNRSEGSDAMVIFAHGSGSSRFSPRNQYVAGVLNDAEISTLLIDLLTPGEEQIDIQTAHLRFNIGMLADRLIAATHWLGRSHSQRQFRVGYFGASTGAAAALVAAAKRPDDVEAIVSRGGRPDLAGTWLLGVHAPTLLIVGEHDETVIRLNEQAAAEMAALHRIEIVSGATHLFEEPGALERVAALARLWFEDYLIALGKRAA